MPDPGLLIALSALTIAYGWATLAHAQARERRLTARRTIGKIRRDRSARALKHRARRWYRIEGRLQLVGAHVASMYAHQRAGRLWRDAKELEAEPADAYARLALPFTTRR